MDEFAMTGGARVGFVNATWPLAKLSVSAQRLKLSGFILGSYEFAPGEVVSLKRYGSIPVVWNGVQVLHCRPDYPSRIVFWCRGSPENLIERILGIGFVPSAPPSSIAQSRGFPIRWTAILLFVLIWNGLFSLDQYVARGVSGQPGPLMLVAFLLLFFVCWGMEVSPRLQRLILRDGHSVSEIKSYLRLIQVIAVMLLIIFGITLSTHGRAG